MAERSVTTKYFAIGLAGVLIAGCGSPGVSTTRPVAVQPTPTAAPIPNSYLVAVNLRQVMESAVRLAPANTNTVARFTILKAVLDAPSIDHTNLFDAAQLESAVMALGPWNQPQADLKVSEALVAYRDYQLALDSHGISSLEFSNNLLEAMKDGIDNGLMWIKTGR